MSAIETIYEDADIDSALERAVEPQAEGDTPPPPPVPDGLAHATRYMRTLLRIRHQQRDIAAVARAEVDRVRIWETQQTERLDKQAKFLEFLLASYHAAVLEANPKAKTVTTPYGSLRARTSAAAPRVVDEAALTQWALDRAPEFVRIDPHLEWGRLKATLRVAGAAVVSVDGEAVPGVDVAPAVTKHSVEVIGDAIR